MYLSSIKQWLSARGIDTLSAWEIIDTAKDVNAALPEDEAELQGIMVTGLVIAIEQVTDDPTYLSMARFLRYDIPLLYGLAPYLLPHQRTLLQDAADSDTPVIDSVVRIVLMGATDAS